MANYQLLKADIDEKIYENAQQKITGENLNSILNAMVATLGAEYQFAGVATIDTNPETSDAKVFYIANGKGKYTNFGNIEVTENDVVILYYDTTWHKVATGIASQEKVAELESKVTTYYRACGTEANVATKVLLINHFVLSQKIRLIVRFDYLNTADDVLLKVGDTPAAPLYFNGQRCSAINPIPEGVLVDIYYVAGNYYSFIAGPVRQFDWEEDGYIAANGTFVDDSSYKTSRKIFVLPRRYTCFADFISKYDKYGNFIERVTTSTLGYIDITSNISFIRISQTVDGLSGAYFEQDLQETKGDYDGCINFITKGSDMPTFVTGLPQIKELFFISGTDYSIIWIRKAFVSGEDAPYWGIAFSGGAETERYSSEPNLPIPIYSSPEHSTIIGYVLVDWTKQSTPSKSGASATIESICYAPNNAPTISLFLGTFLEKEGLYPFATEAAKMIKNVRDESAKSVNLVKRFNKAAISWIDDDFMVNDESNVAKYNALKTFCKNNGIYCDIALIPSDTVGVDTADGSLTSKIDAVREWEDIGFRMLYHPVHYGWYNNSWNTHSLSEVQRRIVEEIRLFLQNAILSKERILVWPGSSNAFADNVAIVEKYCDCAISTMDGYNNGVETGRYQLKRIFPEALLSAGTTKTQIKALILDSVNSGSWLIIGSHIWAWNISDTLDETSPSTANLFDIISYANSLCPIKSTEQCWRERKLMFDWYGK